MFEEGKMCHKLKTCKIYFGYFRKLRKKFLTRNLRFNIENVWGCLNYKLFEEEKEGMFSSGMKQFIIAVTLTTHNMVKVSCFNNEFSSDFRKCLRIYSFWLHFQAGDIEMKLWKELVLCLICRIWRLGASPFVEKVFV